MQLADLFFSPFDWIGVLDDYMWTHSRVVAASRVIGHSWPNTVSGMTLALGLRGRTALRKSTYAYSNQ